MRRLRQAVTLARNLWLLRRELWQLVRRKRPAAPAPVELRCLRCRRPLTKPCRPASRPHVFAWPHELAGPYEPGQLLFVRQTKPGRPVTDIRTEPF